MCKEKLFAGLLGILFLLLSGCANRQQTADQAEATTDLPAIRQRGELVALTLYSSTSNVYDKIRFREMIREDALLEAIVSVVPCKCRFVHYKVTKRCEFFQSIFQDVKE